MIDLKHLERIRKQAQSSIEDIRNPNRATQYPQLLQRINCDLVILGMEIIINKWSQYCSKSMSPGLSEAIAQRDDLVEFRKSL